MHTGTFKAHKNTDNKSQGALLRGWLGTTGERVLESHKWSEADRETVGIKFDKLEQKCHPSKQALYENQFFHD